jgi:biotin carboxyl carrier protein
MMNEIHAEIGGRIAGIAAENGSPVEYGSPLFLIAPLE